LMTKDVLTVTEDTPIEEAARIMVDKKIGGLPVVHNNNVVGIITETDLFRVFLEFLGAREPGVRLAVLVPDTPGKLAKITKAIFDKGGDIIALGTFLGDSSGNREITLKVSGIDSQALEIAVEPHIERIIDMRDSSQAEFSKK